jgi:hypothetical protein
MCGGASSTQEELQQEQADFYRTQVKAYNTAYSNFKDIQDRLNAQFDPIISKGPNQMGFNADELTDLNTQATEGTAANYAAAKRALQNDIAVEGGGTSNVNLTGGPSNQLREELASTAAGVESASQLAIKQAGYAQGYSEYRDAVAGEEDLAAGWNPNSFSGSATSAGKVASDTANEVTKANASTWNAVMGALGGIAGNVSYSKAGGWGLGG